MKTKTNFISTALVLGISLTTNYSLLAQDPNQPTSANDATANQPNRANRSITAQQFVWQAATIDLKEVKAGNLALQKSDNADVKAFAQEMITSHKQACQDLKAIADNEGLSFPDTNSLSVAAEQSWNNNPNADTNNNDSYTASAVITRGGNGENIVTNADGIPSDTAMANNGSDTNAYNSQPIPRGQGSVTNVVVTDTTAQANMAGDTNTTYTTVPQTAHAQTLGTNWDNNNANGAQHGQPHYDLASLSGVEFDRAYAAKMVMGHRAAIRKFEIASTELQDDALKQYAQKTLPTLQEHLRMAEDLQAKLGNVSASNIR